MNQESTVLEHLQAGRSLTQLQAAREFGCLRLAARIYLLRKAGYRIEDEWEQSSTNPKKKWKRYHLEMEQSSEQDNRSGDQSEN